MFRSPRVMLPQRDKLRLAGWLGTNKDIVKNLSLQDIAELVKKQEVVQAVEKLTLKQIQTQMKALGLTFKHNTRANLKNRDATPSRTLARIVLQMLEQIDRKSVV